MFKVLTTAFLLSALAIPVAGLAGEKSIQINADFTQNNSSGWNSIFRDVPKPIYDEYMRRLEAGESLGPVGPDVNQNDMHQYPETASHWLMNAGVYPLPKAVAGKAKTGFLLQVLNHSDDADMWLVKKIGKTEGVAKNKGYSLYMKIEFASEAPEGCMGTGGAPDSLQFFMGASAKDPNEFKLDPASSENILFADGIMKPEFATGKSTGNGTPCDDGTAPYKLVSHDHRVSQVRSDANGNIWLMVGTHSGYESFTALYYTKIQVKLTPLK